MDRLDKELSIGQMQGKFQMQIVGQTGHAVHEDAPDKVMSAHSDTEKKTYPGARQASTGVSNFFLKVTQSFGGHHMKA